ncbi:MAG: 50S ribosomal protein L11 methyltransferase [Lentisphaeria bacterium]|nr:50S ribosomal protein L11 methyltransferase [Lentisphaeria bacterium]
MGSAPTPIPDTPIYAVEIVTDNEDVAVLGELLAAMDFPPQALSSYENLETGKGTSYVLCDTQAEETAARKQVEALLTQWGTLLQGEVHEIRDNVIKREDWSESWKKYFHPFRASRRLVIKPSWEDFSAEPEDILLEIDPGMCFGTGSHGTTRGCLEFLDDLADDGNAERPRSLIDAGCGSGILSMAADKLGYGPIFAFDYDPQAILVTHENFDRCNLKTVQVSEGDVHDLVPPFQADLVLANILAPILLEAKENILKMVRPGGLLVLSGILTGQYDDVRDAFVALGAVELENRTLAEWTSGLFRI